MEGIVVLSLFDGMSCGQIALQKLGIKVKTYYASEIDKHAISVTYKNFPDTIQLGDVTQIKASDLPKIDLLIGGSPCQGFSFAGKQLAFDDPRSQLFFEFVRLKNELNPRYFFLENVKMKKEYEAIISEYMGILPIEINSALVSAQNRVRLYWTNIAAEADGLFGYPKCMIPQPKEKGILLRDILETEVNEKYYLSDKMLNYFKNRASNFNNGKVNIRNEDDKATTILSSSASCDISDNFIKVDTSLKVSNNQEKANCFTAGGNSGGLHSDMTLIVASRGRNPENPTSRKIGLETEQTLEPRFDGKTNCLTSVQKDNLIMQLNTSMESNGCQPYQQNRVYNEDGISPALLADMSSGTHAILQRARGFNKGGVHTEKSPPLTANAWEQNNTLILRRLTPTECERLQTVPDGYTSSASDTQRYRMLGNGWTVDVIAHIFSYIKF